MDYNLMKTILYGVAVGDALGVPVEFRSRRQLELTPLTTMTGYGSHHQPAGTWSDDTSMSLCLAYSLRQGYHTEDVAHNFLEWLRHDKWTATGITFDVGCTTSSAIDNYERGESSAECGLKNENDNGNGSLMRILPLLPYIKDLPVEERMQKTSEISAITHAHAISKLGCIIYLEFARHLLTLPMAKAFEAMQQTIKQSNAYPEAREAYKRVLSRTFIKFMAMNPNIVQSSGYVVHTLEASLWSLFNSHNYAEAVLRAVNLGDDTDTTGAVCGGLAAIAYGYDSIPSEWLTTLQGKDVINRCL